MTRWTRSRRSNFRPGPASRSHSRQPTRSLSTPASRRGFRTRTRRRIWRGTAPPRRRRRPPTRAARDRYAATNFKLPNRCLWIWPLIACCSGAAFCRSCDSLPPAWRILCAKTAPIQIGGMIPKRLLSNVILALSPCHLSSIPNDGPKRPNCLCLDVSRCGGAMSTSKLVFCGVVRRIIRSGIRTRRTRRGRRSRRRCGSRRTTTALGTRQQPHLALLRFLFEHPSSFVAAL